MAFIIDIDGTLINNNMACTGAVEYIDNLNLEKVPYILMTNSIKSPEKQIERLKLIGIKVNGNCILNPIFAINQYIKGKGIKKARVIGSEDEIKQVDAENDNQTYEVVILLDFEKENRGYNDLQSILNDIENDIPVICSSLSKFYYKNGKKIIDTGAFVRLLESISGKEILNFGKPSKSYFDIAGMILRKQPNEVTVLGDDWSTDIKGANGWGAKTILVKSGKYTDGDEAKERPIKVINNLFEMIGNHRTIASSL